MKNWYVVHTQTGSEDKVKALLENRITAQGLSESITKIIIPTEQISEVRSGKRRISSRKFFPGYILVEMDMTDDSWYMIKNITGVTGFVGAGARPIPLKVDEIDTILRQAKDAKEKPTPKVMFEKGEAVRVTEGPFADFSGSVEDVNYDKSKVHVAVTIFGRSTPVELDFSQVEKT